jgi:hypothetical protein
MLSWVVNFRLHARRTVPDPPAHLCVLCALGLCVLCVNSDSLPSFFRLPLSALTPMIFCIFFQVPYPLSPLFATSKTAGVYVPLALPSLRQRTNAANSAFCFQSLPRCPSRNSLPFKNLHCCPGVDVPPTESRVVKSRFCLPNFPACKRFPPVTIGRCP